MHGLTGGDWKRSRNLRKPRQSPTLPIHYLISAFWSSWARRVRWWCQAERAW
jgi:hypothetical protein